MNLILWIPASYLAVLGIFSLLNPELLKDFMLKYAKVKWIRVRGTVLLILGIVFLYTSKMVEERFFLQVMGIVSFSLGMFDLIFPTVERRNANWWLKTPNWVIRLLGIFLLLGGIAFASAPLFATLTNL
jgi:uncharacterized membrane protein HdeD (DUF308 family)